MTCTEDGQCDPVCTELVAEMLQKKSLMADLSIAHQEVSVWATLKI